MKTIKRLWGNIPRKVRACVNVMAIVLVAMIFYYCIGYPAFTLMQRFRRAEKAHLVGPGEIMDHTQWGLYPQFTDMLVAETENGIIFYGFWDQKYPLDNYDVFSYREKTGKLTFLAPPIMHTGWVFHDYDRMMPLYLFDDYPEAVRAGVDIRVVGRFQADNDRYEDCTLEFGVSANRYTDGVFRFLWDISGNSEQQKGGAEILSEISTSGDTPFSSPRAHRLDSWAEITVRLYDAEDNLIVEEELVLRTVAGEAQAKRGEWNAEE